MQLESKKPMTLEAKTEASEPVKNPKASTVKIKAIVSVELAIKVFLAYLTQKPHKNFDTFMTELLKEGLKHA